MIDIDNLTRPIIGIENRTALEAFDIMVDRIRASLSPSAGGDSEIIEALLANKPFVFDPATNFVHADDGGAPEFGIKYVPAPSVGGETVKALEWRDEPIPPAWESLASSCVGLYCIPHGGSRFILRFRDKEVLGDFSTLAKAKAAAQADYERRIRSALVPHDEQPTSVESQIGADSRDNAKEWRCFHCDDVFTTEHQARVHFGCDEMSEPACKIKMGAEGSLVTALRRAEADLADAWAAIHNESTEAAKAYYAQQSRHQEQLRAAEELGYERGLADGRATSSETRKENGNG